MTCVVGISDGKSVYLGADTCISWPQGLVIPTNTPKVLRLVPGVVVGYCGYPRYEDVIQFFAPGVLPRLERATPLREQIAKGWIPQLRQLFQEHGVMETDKDFQGVRQSKFIVGFNGEICVVESNYQVLNLGPEVAIGSGEEVAYGALYATRDLEMPAKKRLRLALEAAAALNAYVRPPYNFVTTK